ncbi:MAG: MBL fold metallo-hydrolase [Patescibacteria group bacterium]|nr:MBL fold metallo-hydrolase [Patescibacteria group bacterium]
MSRIKIIIIVLAVIAAIVGAIFYVNYFQTDRAVFLNVGQGDSIFFRTGKGETILIDGGPDNTVQTQLGKFMPFWERDLDLIILTHPHSDHITGLVEILKRYTVKKIIMTGISHTAPQYLEFLKIIKEQEIPVEIAVAGEIEEVGDIKIEILYPLENLAGKVSDDLNNTSVVAQIDFLNQKFLMMGDAGFDVEKELIKKYGHNLQSDILKVGHHGSRFSTDVKFLEIVSPQTAVICVGENSFGHPSPRTLNHLERAKVIIKRTDLDGNVIVNREERIEKSNQLTNH